LYAFSIKKTVNQMERNMKKIKNILVLAGCVAALGLSSAKVAAQRGNFDPAQMKERITTRVLEEMNVTDDSEKKAITDAIGKVLDARMEVGFGGGMRFGGRRNRGNSTDASSTSTDTTAQNSNRPRGGGGGGFGTPSPEMEDLQKAVDAKDTAAIKASLAKVRESNQAKQAKLEAAQADLQKLLTSRQEAVAVLNGLLK
jgi:hypothetical protein